MPATSFSNLITFSRGTNATVTDSTGRLTYAPNNLFTLSEQFDNAAWSKFATTVTANATTAPDGTTTADRILETTGTSTHLVAANAMVSVVTGQSYTISVYVKPSGRNWFRINSNFSGGSFASFDIANGVLGTVSGGTASITDAGNGWWRCSLTVVSTSTGTASPDFRLATSNATISYAGNASLGVFLWGAQMEAVTYQTTPSTYYPTTVKNLLGYSQDFSNAAWTKTDASITNCPYANPVDGLFTAQKLMENTTNGAHLLSQAVTLPAAPHTISVYARPAGRDWLYFYANNGNQTAYVNVATGQVGTKVGISTITVTADGSGWYRVAMTFANTTLASQNVQVRLASADGTFSYTGDGNSGIYIYGAQLSDSASLDPYVPTPAAAPSSTAYYGPRFDYDPVTLAPKGLLVEEQRTNLLTYSEQFDNGAWSKARISVTPNAQVAPDGTLTADVVTANVGTSDSISQGPTLTAAIHTVSIYLRGTSSSTQVTIGLFSGGFLPATGQILSGPGSISGSGLISVTGLSTTQWTRISFTTTSATPAGSVPLLIYPGGGGTANASIAMWGAQLEAGAFATSYIPTVASTVTRSADVATITGSLFSGWYNQAQGTFLINVDSATTGYRTNLQVDDGTLNNRILIQTNNVATAQQYYVVVGGSAVVNTSAQPFAPSGSKTAAAYNLNDYAYSVNSTAVTTDTSATVPPVTRLFLGTEVSSNYLNGHIRSIQYIPTRASDTQLQTLTTG